MENEQTFIQSGFLERETDVALFQQIKKGRGRPRKAENNFYQKSVGMIQITKDESPLVYSNRVIEWRKLDCERCKAQFTRLDDFQCYLRHLRDEHEDL